MIKIGIIDENSEIWNMDGFELTRYLSEIGAPTKLYWEAKVLKAIGRKFQDTPWSCFRDAKKVDGAWVFVKPMT